MNCPAVSINVSIGCKLIIIKNLLEQMLMI